jgi:predicted transcriptional regulator
MDREKIEQLIKKGLTQREIAKELNLSQTNIRYWLSKFELKTLNRQGRKRFKLHFCRICGENNPEKFYGKDKEVCAKCNNKRVKKAHKEKKQYARKKLGGKCIVCGFNKYQYSLDVHHLNPEIKDENFKSMGGWSIERIDKEIKSCVLLCKNCHTAYHSGEMNDEDKNKIMGN